MKSPYSRTQSIIIEEVSRALEERDDAKKESNAEADLKSDVRVIRKLLQKLMPRIDTYVEYGQLLKIILSHSVEGKSKAHRELKDLFLSGLKED